MSCIIVLGCYRSGTSAAAGILHHLGVFMGSEFDKPNKSNPSGYYEDLDFKRLFDKMSEGFDVDGQLDVLMRIREAEHTIWGFKDPQLCLLMHKVVPLVKTDLKIIVMMRPREEIADSLSRAMPNVTEIPTNWAPLVFQPVKKMGEFIHDYNGPVLHLEWADVKTNPSREVERIANFVGLPVKQEAVDFVRQS